MSWDLNIDFENPEAVTAEVMRLLRERRDALARIPAAAVKRGVFELQAEVQKNVAALRRTPGAGSTTPTMVRSVTVRITEEAGRTVGEVGSFLLLLMWLERGTGLHGPLKRKYEIRPKNKAGLFWGAYTPDGRPIIRKRVMHPGMKPRRPFAKAVVRYLPRFVQVVEQEVAREAKR